MNRRILISLLLVFAVHAIQTALPAHASEYHFQHFQTSEGLQNNSLSCCIQDRLGFIWIGSRDGLARYDGTRFMSIEDEGSEGILRGRINTLKEDMDGMIWFATNKCIGYFNPENETATSVVNTYESECDALEMDSDGNIWAVGATFAICFDKKTRNHTRYPISTVRSPQSIAVSPFEKGGVYITSADGGLLHYNGVTGEFDMLQILPEHRTEAGEVPVHILSDADNSYFVVTNRNKLLKVNAGTGKTIELDIESEKIDNINYIFKRHDTDELWIATMHGIKVRKPDGSWTAIQDTDPAELSNANVMHICGDREGNLWISTFHGGLNLWTNRANLIKQHVYSKTSNSITGRIVRAFASDQDGNIWVGTEDGGLCRFLLPSRIIQDLGKMNGLGFTDFQQFISDGDEILAATYGSCVLRFDGKSGRYIGNIKVPVDDCSSLFLTNDGKLYIGTYHGLFILDKKTGVMKEEKTFHGFIINCIKQDASGAIWVGCYGDGLWKKKAGSGTYEEIFPRLDSGETMSEYITSLSFDRDNDLWICTEGSGICHMDLSDQNTAKRISVEEGLTTRIACAAAEDKNGDMWVSTSRGLVKIKRSTNRVERIYLVQRSEVSNTFSYNSCFVSEEGYVHMGTYNGMISFHPDMIADMSASAPLYITDIYTGEGPDARHLTEPGHSALTSRKISVSQSEASTIAFSYSALTYSNSSRYRYEYTLRKGKGKDELKAVTEDNTVIFRKLPPGNYTFDVSILGANTPESSKHIDITITPPLHASIPAKILYILLGMTVSGIIMWQTLQRKRNKNALELSNLDREKQKEIYESKLNFFTNITHEIRTPLTLIKLPIEKIIENHEYTEESHDDIMTIKSNTDRLLSITNQFLDIKKIQNRQIEVKRNEVEIYSFVRNVCNYFQSAVRERHLEYVIDIPRREKKIISDSDMLEKIICNLLSNAVKFCEKKIVVGFHENEDDNMMTLRVNSDGSRIREEDRENIFTPFFQVRTINSQLIGSSGTGLGLPYSRTLATALGGILILDETVEDCNSFLFSFPGVSKVEMNAASVEEEQDEAMEASRGEFLIQDIARHTVLLAEDSDEMRQYLQKELSRDYTVKCASNGEEAVKILNSNKIDLVLSDVMMPVMDGCQLCNYIKGNIEVSHIPVILITAAVGVDTRIATLEVGADGYIEKPFSIQLLRANISNLFKNREICYRQFTDSPLSHFKTSVVNNLDQQFMDALHETVMNHISDEDLSIDTLSSLMMTSKSTLYRKVKANSGQNINEYIRICRLKKAAELLSSRKYRINEVAYLTGFSSASYFATSFQKQFKISPSNFVKGLGQE